MTKKLATNPTLDGLKENVARYWYTTPDKIDFRDGRVYQDGKLMAGYVVEELSRKRGWAFMDGAAYGK